MADSQLTPDAPEEGASTPAPEATETATAETDAPTATGADTAAEPASAEAPTDTPQADAAEKESVVDKIKHAAEDAVEAVRTRGL